MTAATTPTTRSERLWAFLLLFDAFFVVIFGGALATTLYQHWPSSHNSAGIPVHMAKAERPKPAPTPAPAPAPAAAKTAPAAPAPAPAPKIQNAPKQANRQAPRPLRPSLLSESKPHKAAAPQSAAAENSEEAPRTAPAAAAPAPDAGAKIKAQPVEFHYKSAKAKQVELVGAFIVRGGRKTLVKHAEGLWSLTLYLTPNSYRYWFSVDGKKKLDPANSETNRNASVLTVK
jgi:type IV secretory pathway VirB10-like protein